MTRPRRDRGFSLVELVTVLVIIVVGLSIGLPSVLKATADARRDQCKSNLKMIGLALHNYHDVYNTSPPGWTGHFAEAGTLPRFGWNVAILPFLDQAPLFEQLDMQHHRMEDRDLLVTALPGLRCPADSTRAVNSLRGSFGTSNYSWNCGPVAPPRWADSDFASVWPGQPPTPRTTNGSFFLNSQTRFRSVLDGLSNTLSVGERSVQSRAGLWMGVRGNEYEDDQVTDCSPGNEINTGDNSYSSRHRGGASFLIMDGTVRFINNGIQSRAGAGQDMGTYQKLSHRSDGNFVDF